MKKQNCNNEATSVCEQITNNLLTDKHTDLTDFTDSTYLLMKASFEEKVKLLGYDPHVGKVFTDFYTAIKNAEKSGQPIKNVTQLNNVVGGKFNKSVAAYKAYLEFYEPSQTSESVPQDFSQRVMSSIQVDIESIWRQTQSEIKDTLAEKMTEAESEKSTLSCQLVESGELIDGLRQQIKMMEESLTEYKMKMEELTEVKAQLIQLDDYQKEIECLRAKDVESLEVISELKIENRYLDNKANQLADQNQELQREYELVMAERYRLEGRLEQHLSEQI